ncbi:bacterial nucleoid DNA-binding protein [Hoeflea sp. IMCC20628]|uniref:DNA-binding protein HupB n=1 Tax=Hoeflea sp. IMCC20628 TaxID=1620421 RepID=UPI00063A9FF9|nr:DNA-binding protein HupB [Hoeflea sp. IMCC20628]AKI01024.1 bacterial nucleoid DNA-binding protein [Hoeflea sp. IMCC20628]
MNKNELVAAVAEKSGLSKGDATSAVEAVFETITGELKNSGDVRLIGFGNFTVSRREASKGRNPQTGAEVDIPARNVPKFSAGKGLKDACN